MKNILLIISTFGYLLSNGISGVSFFEYHTGDVDKLGETHGFKLSRAYFTYKNSISDELSFTLQTDVGRLDPQVNDDRWVVYLKKAQLDWKIKNNIKISMGMIGLNMFNVQEKTWGHRFIEKSALDLAGWSSSADLGFGVSKKFTDNLSSSLLITNGEGYKESNNDNYEKISLQILYGENRLDKNDGFNAGIVYSTLDHDQIVDNTVEEINTNSIAGGFIGYARGKTRIGIENYTSDHDNFNQDEDYSGSLLSGYVNYSLNENLTVIARRDILVRNKDNDQLDTSTDIFGIVWNPTKGLSICPNITKKTLWFDWDSDGGTTETEDSVSDLALNFQFKF